MPFVKFTEKGRAFAPKATLSRSGMLSFNDGAYRRFGMKEFDYCVLYYDADTKRIGVQMTNEATSDGARKLRPRTGGGADISAKSFCDYFALGVTETTIYDAQVTSIPEGEIVIIDLNHGTVRKSSKSKANEARATSD